VTRTRSQDDNYDYVFDYTDNPSGYMAAELYTRVMDDFDRYYPGRPDLRPDLEALAHGDDPRAISEGVVRFLHRLRAEE